MEPLLINKESHKDSRGFFQEVLKINEIPFNFKAKFTAISYSRKNVIRGLHFQKKDKQAKIVTISRGKVLDVCLNLKKKSKYFGRVYKFILTPGKVLIIPDYYAHGFECLSYEAYLFYHLNNYQNKSNEGGIIYNDKELKIKWKTKKPILSARDKNLMSFQDFQKKIGSL